MKPIRYRLLSDDVVNAPRFFDALQSMFIHAPDRAAAHMCEAWDISPYIAKGLLSGKIPARIEGDAVVYELTAAPVYSFATCEQIQ